MQPEVGSEVDDEPDPAPQIGDEALGLAVGQRTEHEVEPVQTGRIVVLVDEAGVRRREGLGVRSPTGRPTWVWAVATATSKAGWPANRRNSSAPV